MRELVKVQKSTFGSGLTTHSTRLEDQVKSLSTELLHSKAKVDHLTKDRNEHLVKWDATQKGLDQKKEGLQKLGSIHVLVIQSRTNCIFRRVRQMNSSTK
jgi:hypothetical protein